MAKLPTPGRVKTRLCPPLSPDQAAAVHDLFIRQTVDRLSRCRQGARLVLCIDPPDRLDDAARAYGDGNDLMFLPQGVGNLGDRICDAYDVSGTHGPVLFVGSDSPDLPDNHLAAAGQLLSTDRQIVLGPCDDGGYWCLGVGGGVDLRQVIDGVAWSSGLELKQTRQNALAASLVVEDAPAWSDVDRPADLAALFQRISADTMQGPSLARQLREIVPSHLIDQLLREFA